MRIVNVVVDKLPKSTYECDFCEDTTPLESLFLYKFKEHPVAAYCRIRGDALVIEMDDLFKKRCEDCLLMEAKK